jgi:hypothetical protein
VGQIVVKHTKKGEAQIVAYDRVVVAKVGEDALG